MKKLRTIIIEDEAPARELLEHYLKDYNEIEVIAECPDGFAGLKSISEMKLDLIFLELKIPKLTGLEVLEGLDAVRVHILPESDAGQPVSRGRLP